MDDDRELAALNQLLDEALQLAPNERETWLAGIAPEFQVLAPRLRALFARVARIETKDLFGTMPKIDLEASNESESSANEPASGDVVGPYTLNRKLGAGGMGAVWLAERSDGLLNRQVALKLPHRVWSHSGLIDRMVRERQILASLNHPNIAHLYDAGVTSDGQPYLALEYVEGVRIDEYCKQCKANVTLRLQLLLQVARAVAYAHSKLIVHRDLKPANVLVTASGEVRLLDFGIAKLIQDGQTQETELTQFSGRVLTPDYASPEQILGEPLTTASDVYSLGVLAYELLTSTQPYRVKRDSRRAIEDAVIRMEPVRPSDAAGDAVSRALRGDLDTILLKTLRKDRAERYATADALAEDVDRFLDGRPVLAQPDKLWYRTKKFVSRNKLATGAAAIAMIAILAGAGASLWQARVAVAERERAEEVKEFIASIFREAHPYLAQDNDPTAKVLLQQAYERLEDRTNLDPQAKVELLTTLGRSLVAMSDLDTAERAWNQAVQEAERMLGARHPQTLEARLQRTSVYRLRGRTKEGRAELDALLPELRAAADANPKQLGLALRNKAELAIDDGNFDEAITAATEARSVTSQAYGAEHEEAVGATLVLANAYLFANDVPEANTIAAAAYEQAVRLANRTARGSGHPLLLDARIVYARALDKAGELERAIDMMQQSIAGARSAFGETSLPVGFYTQNLVDLELRSGRIDEAVTDSERAMKILGAHAKHDSYSYVAALNSRAKALLAARRGGAAVSVFADLEPKAASLFGASHPRVLELRAKHALALAYSGNTDLASSRMEALLGDIDRLGVDALPSILHVDGVIRRMRGEYRLAREQQEKALAGLSDHTDQRLARIDSLVELGLIDVELGDVEAAISSFDRAQALRAGVQFHETPVSADALLGRGRALLSSATAKEALTSISQADAFWRDFDPDSHYAGEAALWLSRCYAALNHSVEATEALRRAEQLLPSFPQSLLTGGR